MAILITTLQWITHAVFVWLGLALLTVAAITTYSLTKAITRRLRRRRPTCDHGHPATHRWTQCTKINCWFGCDKNQCEYGHPITGAGVRPPPNHPTMRAHKKLHDGRPLDPDEAHAWVELQERLR